MEQMCYTFNEDGEHRDEIRVYTEGDNPIGVIYHCPCLFLVRPGLLLSVETLQEIAAMMLLKQARQEGFEMDFNRETGELSGNKGHIVCHAFRYWYAPPADRISLSVLLRVIALLEMLWNSDELLDFPEQSLNPTLQWKKINLNK